MSKPSNLFLISLATLFFIGIVGQALLIVVF